MGKRKLEDIKEFKIERKVFDDRTSLAIYKLMVRGVIKTVESLVKEGKESVVLSGKGKKDKWVAIKVYRTEYCDFRSMWKYLVGDPRFFGIKKRRRVVVCNWCKREFKNLKIAFKNKVSCPEPLGFYENVLVMRFIGENGIPSPRLIDVDLKEVKKKLINELYSLIIKEIEKLLRAKIVHGDLSAYNILLYEGKPVLIDFSQGVTSKHPLFKEFLERDIKNINSFFRKIGANVDESLASKMVKKI